MPGALVGWAIHHDLLTAKEDYDPFLCAEECRERHRGRLLGVHRRRPLHQRHVLGPKVDRRWPGLGQAQAAAGLKEMPVAIRTFTPVASRVSVA